LQVAQVATQVTRRQPGRGVNRVKGITLLHVLAKESIVQSFSSTLRACFDKYFDVFLCPKV